MATHAKIANKKYKKKITVATKAEHRRKRSNRSSTPTFQPIEGFQGLGLLSLGDKSKLELREVLGMTRPIFCRVVDVSERTIADVESGKTAKKLIRSYNEVYRLVEALSQVVDRKHLGAWFQTPNNAFDGLKPLEVIERGEIDRLWNMVFQLQSGMPG